MRYLLSFWLFLWAGCAWAAVAEQATFTHDGITRTHYFFKPADAGPETPLVIALHGMGGNAGNLRHGIGLTEELEAAGMAVVYPQGRRLPQGSRHWNAGFDMMPVDDVGYLTALAQDLIAQHDLAQDGVALFGISMGGFMAYHMTCHGDLPIRAVVVVAGAMNPMDWPACEGRDLPALLHIHGLRDPLIRFDGRGHWTRIGDQRLAVPELIAGWVDQMGARPAAPRIDATQVEEQRFCVPGTQTEVQLVVLTDFGHDWPSRATAKYHALTDIGRFLRRTVQRQGAPCKL